MLAKHESSYKTYVRGPRRGQEAELEVRQVRTSRAYALQFKLSQCSIGRCEGFKTASPTENRSSCFYTSVEASAGAWLIVQAPNNWNTPLGLVLCNLLLQIVLTLLLCFTHADKACQTG